jgi:ATP-dependent DNA helicase RecG
MLSDDEIKELFFSLESDRVERKRTYEKSNAENIKKTICAFSNDLQNHKKDSVIFIGQDDDLSCANLLINDDLIQTIHADVTSGNIQPRPNVQIKQNIIINDCKLIAIIVTPNSNAPVNFKGSVYVRVGSSNALATPDQGRQLLEKNRFSNIPFDRKEVLSAGIDDLDIFSFEREFIPLFFSRETIEQNGRSLEQKLQAAKALSLNNYPTPAGLLFFGKMPTHHIPCAYISWRRVKGINLTDPSLDARDIYGTLFEQIKKIEDIFDSHNSENLIMGEGVHTREQLYPKAAFQQLIRNAVFHRNYEGTNAPVRVIMYDDKVEIINPGGLFGSVELSNLGIMSDSRNTTILEYAKVYGLFEKQGMGIQIARKSCEIAGLLPPLFENTQSYFKVTLYNRNAS